MIDSELASFEKSNVFTPDHISEKMSNFLKPRGTLLDPAVGTGNLLKFIEKDKYTIDGYDIKQEFLEQIPYENVSKHCADFITTTIVKKYDNIILNPPYIRFQDLSETYRKNLKQQFTLTGNIDIYYAFILKCLSLLKEDGIMVSITPNSYIYNTSAKPLRKYLIENKYIQEIIDYSSEKVFKGISCYCCITVFSKKNKESFLLNGKEVKYNTLKNNSFFTTEISGKTLGEISIIKNGVATLRDKIFIHSVKKFNEPVWKPITNVYTTSWVLFPYSDDGKLLEENVFKNENPLSYAFLESHKEELAKRDRGNKVYPKWYAFGRTQSLVKAPANAIYVSTLVDPKNITYLVLEPILHISSLCICPKEGTTIETVLEILNKNKDIIAQKSSKRGSGWLNLSSSVLKELS